MLNKSNKQWSAKRLVTEMSRGNINFDCSVQRGYVWDVGRKSLLIHSMIEDFPIPAFFFAKKDNDSYDALDGKQRSNAIYEFMNDQFELSENMPFITLDDDTEYDVQGCKFSDLPDEIQQKVKDYSLTVYYFDGITDEEISEVFYRLNNGRPLTAIELTRVKAKSLKVFQAIADHPAMKFAVTENGKKKYFDEQLAMQMWAICFKDSPSFATKDFRPVIENAVVTTEEYGTIAFCLDKIYDLYQQYDVETKEDKKMLRKLKARTHIVSLVYMAKLYREMDISKSFNSLAHKFFNTTSGTSVDELYNRAAGTGTGQPERVRARMEAVKRFLEIES